MGGRLNWFDSEKDAGRIRQTLIILLVFCGLLPGMASGATRSHDDAVRLNNVGTALMNQLLLEKAIDKFDEAYRVDPSLTVAELNKGIALLYLQRLPEAMATLQR